MIYTLIEISMCFRQEKCQAQSTAFQILFFLSRRRYIIQIYNSGWDLLDIKFAIDVEHVMILLYVWSSHLSM